MNEEWSRFVRWPPLFMAAVLWLMAFPAWAGPGVTYHGRLLRPDGRPVDSSNVRFKIQIRTPELPSCLMYEEIQTRDLSDSQGMFSLTIGQNASTPNAEPFTLEQVFSNTGKALAFPAGHCAGISTVTLNPTDGRQILVSFNDDSFSGWEELPPETINLVPSAFEAVTVGGIRGSQLFRVEDGSGAPQTMAPWSVSA
ncbi:MAG TPA: hypothetical protein PL182_12035, partial [Pseudobdellovibrionaceae bacterium]|nr:hypothetical protein [Pseudobdellovibrionaceae bacterium]